MWLVPDNWGLVTSGDFSYDYGWRNYDRWELDARIIHAEDLHFLKSG